MSINSHAKKWKYAAVLSVAGFALSPIFSKTARGSAYYVIYFGILSSTTTVGVLTTAGLVYLILKLTDIASIDGEEDETLARALLESGLLNSRSDLGIELTLLAESPTAFVQISNEIEAGEGPALASLVHSTGISQEQLIEDWKQTAKRVGPVTNEASATRFVIQFLFKMGPNLEVHQAQLAEFVWQLAVEQASPALADGGSAHKWLSHWMGIPLESAHAASRVVFGQHSQEGVDLRVIINQNPGTFLHALSKELESKHRPQIQNRVDELVAEFNQSLPPGMLETLGQPG